MTDTAASPARRSYEDACGTAHALDLVGERWALLVMRELMLGPKRFGDLRAGLPGISANVLTQRLEGLERAGALRRRRLPPPASVGVYELTPWGYEIGPALLALGRWAVRSPTHDPTLPLSPTALALSFRAMFDPGRAEGLRIRVWIRSGPETFLVAIADGRLSVARDPLERADATLAGPSAAIAAAVYGGAPLPALRADGAVGVDGDLAVAERFVTLFPLPPKAEGADHVR